MEIQFTNIDNLWVAEFEVTKDFNLHLERDTEGRLDIYQRTAGGDYEYIYDIGYLNRRTVYDNDFQALVYPKWIKIKSAVKPLIATITTDGEVNEVVYQAKDIEITSNGTTKVTADTGYTALGSVNVKVNVPTEGGGNGGGGLNIQYYDVVGVELDEDLWYCCVNQKWFNHGDCQVSITNIKWGTPQIFAIAVCENMIMKFDWEGNGIIDEISVKDVFARYGTSLNSLPRITEEEFYHIPQDEVWPLNTQDDYKTAWDKLYPLVERYGADYINENKLSLAPWYKSLTIGDNVVTELSWYSLAEDGDSKRERISFTQYTGIEKYTYTDGTIEYQSYNPLM